MDTDALRDQLYRNLQCKMRECGIEGRSDLVEEMIEPRVVFSESLEGFKAVCAMQYAVSVLEEDLEEEDL